jgi:hypothetical protein
MSVGKNITNNRAGSVMFGYGGNTVNFGGDSVRKRICYENVLKINKQNRAAREGLRSLEPQADPLVAALQQKTTPSRDEMEYIEEEEPILVSETSLDSEVGSEGETPTFILVAVGLALSVVVMAIGGGLIFYFITSFTSG